MSMDKKRLTKLLYFMASFDGGVYKNGKECLFIINMLEENSDYIFWVQEVLENITSTNTRVVEGKGNRKPLLRLWSKSHPVFSKMRERMYLDNKKVLDPHMLTLLDDEALAIIFMADGSSSLDLRNKKPHCKIDLCTKGFSYFENLALSKAIYEKCGIRTSVHRHKTFYYLNIKTADHLLFVETILPHLKPSFYYKLERIAPALKREWDDEIV